MLFIYFDLYLFIYLEFLKLDILYIIYDELNEFNF